MVNVRLHNHVAKIEETCGGGAKEFTLEKILDNVIEDRDSVHFGLKLQAIHGGGHVHAHVRGQDPSNLG